MNQRNQRLLLSGIILALLASSARHLLHEKSAQDSALAVSLDQPQQSMSPVSRPPKIAPLALHGMARVDPEMSEVDPFSPKSWLPAPPPLPLPAPVTPSAPPLPFSYVGALEQNDGEKMIYLSKGSASFMVQKGDLFDSDYRLEEIQDSALIIQYLPLATKQTLSTASAS